MENLYIQVENGEPINHPAFESNLIDAFGSIPSNWEPFERLTPATIGLYQTFESQVSYEKVNGVWTDIHIIRDMTQDEISAKQQLVKDAWAKRPHLENFTAWTFDEATCQYLPPTPKPTDGQNYFWQGTTNTWVVIPVKPNDGQSYRFDIPTATWVLLDPQPSA